MLDPRRILANLGALPSTTEPDTFGSFVRELCHPFVADNTGVRNEQICDDFDKSGIIRLIDGGPLMPARGAPKHDDVRWVALKARSGFATLRAHEAGALYTRS
jgi:hypothetical protein